MFANKYYTPLVHSRYTYFENLTIKFSNLIGLRKYLQIFTKPYFVEHWKYHNTFSGSAVIKLNLKMSNFEKEKKK
jgi:hypothetical protein